MRAVEKKGPVWMNNAFKSVLRSSQQSIFFPLIVACYYKLRIEKKIILLLHEHYVLCNTEISPPLVVLHFLLENKCIG